MSGIAPILVVTAGFGCAASVASQRPGAQPGTPPVHDPAIVTTAQDTVDYVEIVDDTVLGGWRTWRERTDAWPAFGLHYEVELSVEAGILAADVLTPATLGAARVMGMDDELGSVTPRKPADLILADGDPVTDIRDSRRDVTVIVGGSEYGSSAIYRPLGVQPCCEE